MATEAPVVRLHRTIPAPPAQVYRAWLEPELVQRWLAPPGLDVTRVEIDERVGGHHRIWQGDGGHEAGGFESELLELVPGERIVFHWGFVGPDRHAGPTYDSKLTVTLSEAPGGETELTLVHEQLDALNAALPHIAELVGPGWEMTLERLDAAIGEAA